ncbi:hypothetical protein C240_1912 [Enterococcus sp. 5H]|nr:hypothetical protein [Enterococcus sp. 5H]
MLKYERAILNFTVEYNNVKENLGGKAFEDYFAIWWEK